MPYLEKGGNDVILSASRRTDIPAFFSSWFVNRMREGYVMVRNPMNYHQVSKVDLSPDFIDCVVFWTKNAKPIIPFMEEIAKTYPFYFQYTLNAYGKDLERNIPELPDKIRTLRTLSETIGKERIVWRYDPIVLSDEYDIDWHLKSFEKLAEALSEHVDRCVFSFLDIYPKIKRNISTCNARVCNGEDMVFLAKGMAEIGRRNDLRLSTCAEMVDLDEYGIMHNKCIDPERISKITGSEMNAGKDKNQRPECGCVESVDIGHMRSRLSVLLCEFQSAKRSYIYVAAQRGFSPADRNVERIGQSDGTENEIAENEKKRYGAVIPIIGRKVSRGGVQNAHRRVRF